MVTDLATRQRLAAAAEGSASGDPEPVRLRQGARRRDGQGGCSADDVVQELLAKLETRRP